MKKIISCTTCKYRKKACEFSYSQCLDKKGRTDLPDLPKRNKLYHYFKWSPIWDDCLPDELFEI